MRIMFVCTGNSCRSPMAELYFREVCRKMNRSDVVSLSSGLYAPDGASISRPAREVMAELGIDAETFRSRSLTPELADSCDLIVTMTRNHRRAILQMLPNLHDRCRTLLPDADVSDPFGGDTATYRTIFRVMQKPLEQLAKELPR